ncbi:DNA/RNA non-specific endonuclease [Loigolactobacillus coryniformis]|uniref:DNA/RNA non-specific endonuclease n=1 Tax=Loigolactobacillus coryniformis TaxID=1610 RepID=UPI0024BEDA5C|nr:DNA/RNA non-specific endonuclease [Loigolactobacillus coryniformis]
MQHKKNWFIKLGLTILASTLMGLGTVNSVTTTVHGAKVTKSQTGTKTTLKQQNAALLKLNYTGEQTVEVNSNHPTFTKANLSTSAGAWQKYANLDNLNRPVVANALLSKSLMPTEKREPLTVDPTGWRNKKIKSGYLYNRSHLIGFQLTGQNNNPKNLITGTRSLNSPEMLRYEDDIAYYIKQNPTAYVRYQVTPVFKDDELVARGVHMQAQSTSDNGVSFNVYIFNIETGVTINYSDGTSQVSANAQADNNSSTSSTPPTTSVAASTAGQITTDSQGQIVGNKNSKIYHTPDQSGYKMNGSNAVYFNTEAEAQAAGYRKSMR